ASKRPSTQAPAHRDPQSTPADGNKRAHLHLEENRPRGHHGRRKEQSKDESNRGRASDHQEFRPADAVRKMKTCGHCHTSSRDDAEGPSECSDWYRPHADLQAVQRDTCVDESKREEHSLDWEPP